MQTTLSLLLFFLRSFCFVFFDAPTLGKKRNHAKTIRTVGPGMCFSPTLALPWPPPRLAVGTRVPHKFVDYIRTRGGGNVLDTERSIKSPLRGMTGHPSAGADLAECCHVRPRQTTLPFETFCYQLVCLFYFCLLCALFCSRTLNRLFPVL